MVKEKKKKPKINKTKAHHKPTKYTHRYRHTHKESVSQHTVRGGWQVDWRLICWTAHDWPRPVSCVCAATGRAGCVCVCVCGCAGGVVWGALTVDEGLCMKEEGKKKRACKSLAVGEKGAARKLKQSHNHLSLVQVLLCYCARTSAQRKGGGVRVSDNRQN